MGGMPPPRNHGGAWAMLAKEPGIDGADASHGEPSSATRCNPGVSSEDGTSVFGGLRLDRRFPPLLTGLLRRSCSMAGVFEAPDGRDAPDLKAGCRRRPFSAGGRSQGQRASICRHRHLKQREEWVDGLDKSPSSAPRWKRKQFCYSSQNCGHRTFFASV